MLVLGSVLMVLGLGSLLMGVRLFFEKKQQAANFPVITIEEGEEGRWHLSEALVGAKKTPDFFRPEPEKPSLGWIKIALFPNHSGGWPAEFVMSTAQKEGFLLTPKGWLRSVRMVPLKPEGASFFLADFFLPGVISGIQQASTASEKRLEGLLLYAFFSEKGEAAQWMEEALRITRQLCKFLDAHALDEEGHPFFAAPQFLEGMPHASLLEAAASAGMIALPEQAAESEEENEQEPPDKEGQSTENKEEQTEGS